MNATRPWQLLLALGIVGAIWAIASPAQALPLAAGCSCPTGSLPLSTPLTCVRADGTIVPAICPGRNIGHVAAAQQQQSFWGVQMMLQQKRDQLQSTPAPAGTSSRISGYSSSASDSDADALAYSGQSQKTNPLASSLYDVAPSSAPANPIWGTWVQGLGDSEHDNALSTTDVAHLTNTYTAQAGLDRTQQGVLSADDALVLGIVSSWTSSHVSYDNSSTTMNLVGPGIGVYSEYVKGGFSADATTKFDFLQMSEDLAGSSPNTSVGILNAGVSGNVQYKFMGDGNNFFEPTMGFSLTHTSFGSGATALSLEDAYTVRLQAGARLGTTWDAGHGVSIDSSLKALVYGDAVAQGTSILGANTLGPLAISPVDEGMVRGELDPELCFNLPNDYSVTLSGQLRYGRDMVGESVGLNLRKQW